MDGNEHRLLIVDDDAVVAETTALVFVQAGYEVRVALSAEQALRLIREWGPSAAIIEVLLSGMSGIELAEVIQRNCPDCRIVLFTTPAVDGAPTSGSAFLTLTKPVHPTELLTIVGAHR